MTRVHSEISPIPDKKCSRIMTGSLIGIVLVCAALVILIIVL